MLTSIGSPIAAGEVLPKWFGIVLACIGPALAMGALVAVYFARRSYLKQADSKRRRLRAEKHDEMWDEVERAKRECVEQFSQNRQWRQELEDEWAALRSERAAMRESASSWTPIVVAQHASVSVATLALFASDRHTRKPTLLIEWHLTSLANAPCDIIIEGATITLFTLPAPGEALCRVNAGRVDVAFDGRLSPGSIALHRSEHISLTDEQSTVLRSKLSSLVAVTAIVEFRSVVRTGGEQLLRLPAGDIVERIITTPPEWIVTTDKAA